MGLDTTHDCWHGGYGSFSIWREILCEAAGWPADGPEPHRERQSGSRVNWEAFNGSYLLGEEFRDRLPEDPLIVLVAHSDCEGILPVSVLLPLADRLEELAPNVPAATTEIAPAWLDVMPDRTVQFIRGLRLAAAAGQEVEFH